MYKIFDLHNDFFTSKKFRLSKQNYYSKASQIAEKFASVVWTSEFSQQDAMKKLYDAKKFEEHHEKCFFAIEDLHFLTKDTINEVANLHPKYAGLTWNYDNNLAGGALEFGDLSGFGKNVIKSFENNNIIIDTAHLNEKSFMSVANYCAKPIICSHTASFSVNSHPRNLKDYQVKIIIESGGIVGICLVSDFLTGKRNSTVLDYIKHIDYLVNKFGIDSFAIGTDFCGTNHLPSGITDYKSLQKELSLGLEKLGYKPNDINKLFCVNARKIFEQ